MPRDPDDASLPAHCLTTEGLNQPVVGQRLDGFPGQAFDAAIGNMTVAEG